MCWSSSSDEGVSVTAPNWVWGKVAGKSQLTELDLLLSNLKKRKRCRHFFGNLFLRGGRRRHFLGNSFLSGGGCRHFLSNLFLKHVFLLRLWWANSVAYMKISTAHWENYWRSTCRLNTLWVEKVSIQTKSVSYILTISWMDTLPRTSLLYV